MDKLNSFFEDLPSLSLHDISNRVTEELARFSNSARKPSPTSSPSIPSPPSSPSIPSPTPGTVRNDEEAFDKESSIIDLIERANTSTRDQFSPNVASPSASETKSETPSHHDQKLSSNDSVIPVPLPEHIPPTMSNRVSIQKQTPPPRETVKTTPPIERIPPNENQSRHHPTRLPVPSSAPAARSSTMPTSPSAPPPPYAGQSIRNSPPAPRRNNNLHSNKQPKVPTASFKPTAQPPSFPSVSSIEHNSPQNFDAYRQMQEEVLRMQLHALQQKQRAVRIQPFYKEFKGEPTDLLLFLEKLSMKVNHHFQGSRFFLFNRGDISVNILTSYETVSTTEVLTHLSRNLISFDDDELLYESIINSLHHTYHQKITSRLTMARRNGRQSGVLATLLIAKDCSLQRKSGHILADEYSHITLARSKNNVVHLCGEFNRRFQELQQHGWDITANGKHADPVFRELLLFPSPAFTSVIAPEFAKFSNLPLHMRHTYNIHELFSIATKVFINLPVAPSLDNTPFNETSNLSALTSALVSLQRHLSSPPTTDSKVQSSTTKRTNEPGSKGRYSLWRDPQPNEPQSHVIKNGKTIQFCKLHKWNPSHGNDKCYKQLQQDQPDNNINLTNRQSHLAESNMDPVEAWKIIQSLSTDNPPASNE